MTPDQLNRAASEMEAALYRLDIQPESWQKLDRDRGDQSPRFLSCPTARDKQKPFPLHEGRFAPIFENIPAEGAGKILESTHP